MNTNGEPSRTPQPSELPRLRKGRRKRRIPTAQDGMVGEIVGQGSFHFRTVANDLKAEWSIGPSESPQARKTALWSELCRDPARELDRLELGWLIADAWKREGDRMLTCIPGPNEAMAEANRYWQMADAWRHWAVVAAGHMVFPEE